MQEERFQIAENENQKRIDRLLAERFQRFPVPIFKS